MKILHIVDMQNSFLRKNGVLSIPGGEPLIKRMNNFIESLPLEYLDYVILTLDTHFPKEYQYSDESSLFPLHCNWNTEDWQLAIDINLIHKKAKKVYKIYKNIFDVWGYKALKTLPDIQSHPIQSVLFKVVDYASNKQIADNIDEFLNNIQYPKEDTEVIVVGVAADYCVKYAIEGYLERNYQLTILKELTKGISQEIDNVLKNLANKYNQDQWKLEKITHMVYP